MPATRSRRIDDFFMLGCRLSSWRCGRALSGGQSEFELHVDRLHGRRIELADIGHAFDGCIASDKGNVVERNCPLRNIRSCGTKKQNQAPAHGERCPADSQKNRSPFPSGKRSEDLALPPGRKLRRTSSQQKALDIFSVHVRSPDGWPRAICLMRSEIGLRPCWQRCREFRQPGGMFFAPKFSNGRRLADPPGAMPNARAMP